MSPSDIKLLWLIIVASACFLIVPIVWSVISKIIFSRKHKSSPRVTPFNKKLLMISAMLMASIWCLRYSVGYYSVIVSENPESTLTWWEEIFNSMIHALQTFSMDEDYTEYVFAGKRMMAEISGNNSGAVAFYGIYSFALNVLAPIAGGAIIFEILTGIFPRLRLFFLYLAFFKDKYFFSELNERSLALAKSIVGENKRKILAPVIIFTDTYIDDEDEKDSEMLVEAKLLGSVCVRDDISHISKNRYGKRTYILIDDDEMENLQTLTNLSDEFNYPYLKSAEIVLFSQNDVYTQVEKKVREKLVWQYGFDVNELPTVIPVQCYKNLVNNLFVDMPLYEPLVGKKRDENNSLDLNVTVLGMGFVGTEAVLSAYWMGQMLDCRLNITVISKEDRECFFGKISRINPDIIRTATDGDSILVYNKNGDVAEKYCSLRYFQQDVDFVSSNQLSKIEVQEGKTVLDTDYFVVALGSDEENLSVANKLCQLVGAYHLSKDESLKTVIAYAIYNSSLCNDLNRSNLFSYNGKGTNDIVMKAFGSLENVYSVNNVFMPEHSAIAFVMNNFYDNAMKTPIATVNKQRNARNKKYQKRIKDEYAYQASIARGMHLKYKMFSCGLIESSLFDYGFENDPGYKQMLKNSAARYKALISGEGHDLELMHRLAWLEHRRWNSFLRVNGFRYTADYMKYYQRLSTHKNLELKLHPCLVESDQRGIRAEFDKNGKILEETAFKADKSDLDLLDELSYELKTVNPDQYDFKLYDYPVCDF